MTEHSISDPAGDGHREHDVPQRIGPARTLDSSQILAGCREVRILHGGETYRLLVTRNNKLILQK
ncbi:MAG: hemin uptake protein HemP [Planctomycetaceae bacterium]|nr:hemin uptake protein HemP [Planctomycetaceae bacterium]